MDNIIEPTMDYDFSKLYLGPPSTIPGGSYFTRIMYGSNKSLFIQTPKSLTKQGFVKSGKKVHTDLMFDNNDTIFINWIENLEIKCQELIYGKSESWFENKLEKDDIDTAFTSPFKIFKSGKFYLLRVNVKPTIKIYDENDNLLNMDELTGDKNLISILEIQGIKFTSKNFQIEIELKQAMSVSPDPFLEECFIKKPIKGGNNAPIIPSNPIEPIITTNNPILEPIMDPIMEPITNNTNIKTEIDEFIKENLYTNTTTILDEKKFREETIKNTKLNEGPKTNEGPKIVSDVEPILLDVEELDMPSNDLKEFDITSTLETNLEAITLKQSNQVYYDIYKKAREKAKQAKKDAIMAYLEVKNIKKTYMIEDMDNSDEDEDNASETELDDLDSNISVDEAGETYH